MFSYIFGLALTPILFEWCCWYQLFFLLGGARLDGAEQEAWMADMQSPLLPVVDMILVHTVTPLKRDKSFWLDICSSFWLACLTRNLNRSEF